VRHPSTVTKYGWQSWLGDRDRMVLVTVLGRSYVVIAAPLADGLRAMDQALKATGYEDPCDWIGSYNKRPIAGTEIWSTHSYGIAIDLDYGGDNPDSPDHPGIDRNPHIRRPITMNDRGWGVQWQINKKQVLAVEAIRTNNGKPVWKWLGWAIGDTMHFQVTCSEADLATGINPATVATGEEVTSLAVALGERFWKALVDEGLINGDPAYYYTGAASDAEVSNALAVAVEALVDNTEDALDEAERANKRLDEV
jgi:hypothetical protein